MAETKSYIVGKAGAYREGRLYAEGETITIPADEKPSKTWLQLDGSAPDASASKAPETPPSKSKGRAADRDVA